MSRSICIREDRDERGRLLPGHTANLAGKPVRKPFARLLAAAEAVGAQVVVMVPPRAQAGAVTIDDDPILPVAA